MIGFDVGGGYDLYARAVARHLTKHIPGNPVFVPQNMPGAGSRGAANWLYNVAAKDGTANDHADLGDRPDAAGDRHSLRRGEAQPDRQSDGGQPDHDRVPRMPDGKPNFTAQDRTISPVPTTNGW